MIRRPKLFAGICGAFFALMLFPGCGHAAGKSDGKVTASAVRLRSGPGLSYKIKTNLTKGSTLDILAQNGNWYKVSLPGNQIGWVLKDYVSVPKPVDTSRSSVGAKTNSTGTVSASGVRLRGGPGLSYKIVGNLKKGEKLRLLAKNGEWCKVSTASGSIGWVHKNYFSLAQDVVSRGGTRESTIRESIVNFSQRFLGVKYVWGGSSPAGFDCSGFVQYVFGKFGIQLGHSAADQARTSAYVSKENLQPGDLVFFDTDGGHNYINHVGIYIGGGRFIDASSGRGSVVIASISEGFYANTYMSAGRVL